MILWYDLELDKYGFELKFDNSCVIMRKLKIYWDWDLGFIDYCVIGFYIMFGK